LLFRLLLALLCFDSNITLHISLPISHPRHLTRLRYLPPSRHSAPRCHPCVSFSSKQKFIWALGCCSGCQQYYPGCHSSGRVSSIPSDSCNGVVRCSQADLVNLLSFSNLCSTQSAPNNCSVLSALKAISQSTSQITVVVVLWMHAI